MTDSKDKPSRLAAAVSKARGDILTERDVINSIQFLNHAAKVIKGVRITVTDEPKSLTPDDVVKMPLAEFEQCFGFRPVDALEKKFFAVTGKRPDQFQREAIEARVLGDISHDGVVMK